MTNLLRDAFTNEFIGLKKLSEKNVISKLVKVLHNKVSVQMLEIFQTGL